MEAFGLLVYGFSVLLTWKILALMMVGLVLGIFVGVLPGLGGPNGVAILLPLTFTMDPTSAIVMLSCIYWGALFGGAITSILFNIPGEAWSVATTFDGYPMAQQGKAAEALTAAFTSSFIGSLVAVLLITFLAPGIASFALRFGPPEFFAVYLLTFCSFVGLGREEKHKTIISMTLGLLLAGVGMDTVSGQLRMTFGSNELLRGINFLVAVIGLFGISEILLTMEERLALRGNPAWRPDGVGAEPRPAAVRRAQGLRLGPDRVDVSGQCRRPHPGTHDRAALRRRAASTVLGDRAHDRRVLRDRCLRNPERHVRHLADARLRGGRLCIQEDRHSARSVHAGAGAREPRRGRLPAVHDRGRGRLARVLVERSCGLDHHAGAGAVVLAADFRRDGADAERHPAGRQVRHQMSGEVLLARDGDIATVTLSNPGRMNALDLAMWERLGLLAKELQNDESLRCVVVRGAGEKAFAAGADIAAFATERANSRQAKEYGRRIAAAMHSFAACRHPVVALIQGACVGGGLLVASQCDLRICNESARIGVPVKNLGLVEAYDELQGMMNVVGRAAALEILLEGRIWGAREAYEKGLVNRVVADDRVVEEAYATARRIADGAPLAARWHKKFVRRLADARPLSEAEYDESYACFDTEDVREGVAAFLAKRKPQFKGR